MTALTRSINTDTSDAMNVIQRIETNRDHKTNKKLESIDLQKMIKDTKKDFKIALYNLCKATHDMKPKTLPLNTPMEFEVIDVVPSLFKVYLDGAKPPLSIHITYLSTIKGKFLLG